jgi:hypothetical protein
MLHCHKNFSRVKAKNLSVACVHRPEDDTRMTNPSTRVPNPCHDTEPPLAELLNDSVLQWLLVGDRIDRAELDAVIRRAQQRLGPQGQSATPIAECCA